MHLYGSPVDMKVYSGGYLSSALTPLEGWTIPHCADIVLLLNSQAHDPTPHTLRPGQREDDPSVVFCQLGPSSIRKVLS